MANEIETETTSAPADTTTQPETQIDPLGGQPDTIEAQWPIPAGDTFDAYNRTYRFCAHCHTPKPVAQIRPADAKTFPGVCATCYNGMLNYDRLTRLGVIPARPGYVAPTAAAAKAKATTSTKTPRLVKITLEDGTVVEGIPIKAPKAPKAVAEDTAQVDADGTSTISKKGKKGTLTPAEAPAEATSPDGVETTIPA
jgi:hypothetical protein